MNLFMLFELGDGKIKVGFSVSQEVSQELLTYFGGKQFLSEVQTRGPFAEVFPRGHWCTLEAGDLGPL